MWLPPPFSRQPPNLQWFTSTFSLSWPIFFSLHKKDARSLHAIVQTLLCFMTLQATNQDQLKRVCRGVSVAAAALVKEHANWGVKLHKHLLRGSGGLSLGTRTLLRSALNEPFLFWKQEAEWNQLSLFQLHSLCLAESSKSTGFLYALHVSSPTQ